MNEVASKVCNCFLAVFPDLKPEEVGRISADSFPQWDSVAHVTLLTALSETFQFELDEDSFQSLTSYSRIIDFVENRVPQN